MLRRAAIAPPRPWTACVHLLALVLLAACGPDATPETPPTPPAPAAPVRAAEPAFPEAAAEGPPERIVLITLDTLRADRVGAWGHAGAATPVLDRLAAEGVRFETAISPAPLTLPSHASLMTGLDPPHHGAHHNTHFRVAGVPTLARQLKQAGWPTAAFVGAFVLDRRFGLADGFDHYDDQMGMGDAPALLVPERRGDHVVDAARAWLAEAPDRFFLWLHLYDIHASYDPPEPFRSRFRHDLYDGEVAFADQQVGRLLETLASRWTDGRTLIVVTADHGESLGEHGEPTHSYGIYDATQHVPLILYGPGLPAGRRVADLVRLVDVAPTLLELAQAPALPDVDGASLLPLLRGESAPPRVAYMETLATWFDMGWSPLYGLRTATEKLVLAPRPELYDLTADPTEHENLADARPEERAALEARLRERLAGAPPARPNLHLDDAERRRLEALGYVTTRADAEPAEGLVLGTTPGADPKDRIEWVTRMNQANAALALGDPERTLELMEPLEDEPPEWIHTLRALALLKLGRDAEARVAAERALANRPDAILARLLVGQTYERAGELKRAAELYREAAAQESGEGSPYTALGRLAERAGDLAEAERLYVRARESRVPDPESLWRLGALRLEQGRVDEAGSLLAQVPAAALREPEAAVRVAGAELAAGRPELAEVRVRAALREHDEIAPLHRRLGEALEQQGRFADARAARERARALAPDDPVIANDLAFSLAMTRRDLDRALALAQEALRAMPEEPAVLDTLAAVRLARGERQAAEEAVARALPEAQGETRRLLLVRRAELAAGDGRLEEARRDLTEATDGTPSALVEAEAGRVREALTKQAPRGEGSDTVSSPFRHPGISG